MPNTQKKNNISAKIYQKSRYIIIIFKINLYHFDQLHWLMNSN